MVWASWSGTQLGEPRGGPGTSLLVLVARRSRRQQAITDRAWIKLAVKEDAGRAFKVGSTLDTV